MKTLFFILMVHIFIHPIKYAYAADAEIKVIAQHIILEVNPDGLLNKAWSNFNLSPHTTHLKITQASAADKPIYFFRFPQESFLGRLGFTLRPPALLNQEDQKYLSLLLGKHENLTNLIFENCLNFEITAELMKTLGKKKISISALTPILSHMYAFPLPAQLPVGRIKYSKPSVIK